MTLREQKGTATEAGHKEASCRGPMRPYSPKETLLTMIKKLDKVEILKNYGSCDQMAKRAQQEEVPGEEYIGQPARGIQSTVGKSHRGVNTGRFGSKS